MTPQEFKHARCELGLTLAELAAILDVAPRTVRKWEATRGSNARPPNPIACQVVRWMLVDGRPPVWPVRKGD